MAESGRFHMLQIELRGEEILLHGHCVREVDDPKGGKLNAGNCTVRIKVTAAEVKPLLDKMKTELARLAGLEGGPQDAKQFAGVTVK